MFQLEIDNCYFNKAISNGIHLIIERGSRPEVPCSVYPVPHSHERRDLKTSVKQ